MKKIYDKNPVATGIISALLITTFFYIIEWILWKYTSLTDGVRWTYIDFIIRMLTGCLGLCVLKVFYQDKLKNVFTGKIAKQAWLCLIPIGIIFALYISKLFCAENLRIGNTVPFLIAWLTQIGSGFYEEIVSRGVLMSGLLIKYKDSVRGRILIITFTGFIFGFSHLMNVIYGNNFIDCIWWGLETFTWGIFIAAIYMMTSNLWLVIGIHTVWDIVIRIPRYYMGTMVNETFEEILSIVISIISNGVLPIIAIVVCFCYFKSDCEKLPANRTSQKV